MKKAALITGSARRIGAAIATALHGAGIDVIVHYHRSAAAAAALVAELNGHRADSACALQANLLDLERIDGLAAEALACFGRLDALINNASTFYPTPVGNIDASAWDDLVGTNLKAPIFLSQALAPALKASRGAVVNIADIHAELPMRQHLVYNVAKAGLVAATRSLARELGPEVRVNAVGPGANLWPEDIRAADVAARQRVAEHCPLQRGGTPADIAAAVKFLVLDAAYVTGHVMVVDGGRSLVLPE